MEWTQHALEQMLETAQNTASNLLIMGEIHPDAYNTIEHRLSVAQCLVADEDLLRGWVEYMAVCCIVSAHA